MGLQTVTQRVASSAQKARRRTVTPLLGKLMGEKRNVNELWIAFERAMKGIGFDFVDARKIDSALKAKGLMRSEEKSGVIKSNERVYNLGLDGRRSNFFVYARITDGDKIEVFFTNPTKNEMALHLVPEQIFIRREIVDGGSNWTVNRIVNEIAETAGRKEESDYRMQMHFHAHYLFSRHDTLFDDGASGMADVLRRLMLYHTDVFCPTPHNSSDRRVHRILNVVGEILGMEYVPGFELTMTIGALNGPHVVVMANSIGTAEKLRRDILERRDSGLEMPPYFSGMMMPEMFDILEGYKKKGEVALLVAHPTIQEAYIPERFMSVYYALLERGGLDPRLHITGMFSAVETGLISIGEAIGNTRKCTSITAYNNLSLEKELQLENTELKRIVWVAVGRFFRKLANKIKLTPNSASMALAKSFERRRGMNTHYESDEHETKPFGGKTRKRFSKKRDARYLAGGDGFGAGFTQLEFNPEFLMIGKKPTTREIIAGLETGDVKMRAVVFAEVDEEGILRTVKSRSSSPKYGFIERMKLKFTRGWVYVKSMAKTLWNFLIENKWFELKRLTK